MSRIRLITLTVLSLLAFAGNSLLCRAALRDGAIDAASFTLLRMVSGALVLVLLVGFRNAGRGDGKRVGGSWWSAVALFAYAAGFSFAYHWLSAATGALLLFGAVQVTMVGYGIWRGERLSALQVAGLLLAFAGLVILIIPGLSAPPWQGALLMLLAGTAWGMYSLRGRGAGDPLSATAGNFARTVPMAILLSVLMLRSVAVRWDGVLPAVASGALTSGLGYAIWYTALPALRASTAAVAQLGVPMLAAVGGLLLLHEPVTLRIVLAAIAVLGGIALVTLPRDTSTTREQGPRE